MPVQRREEEEEKNIWTVGEGKIAQRRIRRSGVSADEIFVSSPALRAFALCRLETCCLAAVEIASRDWSLYFTRKDSQMGTYKIIMHRDSSIFYNEPFIDGINRISESIGQEAYLLFVTYSSCC